MAEWRGGKAKTLGGSRPGTVGQADRGASGGLFPYGSPMADAQAHATGFFGRKGGKGLLALVVVLVFLSAIAQVTTPDTWVHLSLGRWMFERGEIPHTNILSYTQPDRPVVDHEWLYQAGLYRLWSGLGLTGTTLVNAGLVAAAFGLALATALRKGSSLIVACFATLLAAAAARSRFTLRPQVVAFLLLSVYLLLLERWRHGRALGLLWLLPLQVLWANLHGSSLIGYALPLGYAAGESVRGLLARRFGNMTPQPLTGRKLATLWAVAIALVPLTALNPSGVRVLTFPFTHAAAQSAMGLKELLEDRAAMTWSGLSGPHLLFAALAALGLLSLVVCLARKDVTEAGLLLGTLVAALHSVRFVELFAIAAAPIVARNVSPLLAGPLAQLRRALDRRAGGLLSVGLLALCLALLGGLGVVHSAGRVPFGLGVARSVFPVGEVEYLKATCPTGRLFNEFEHGGYVHWHTGRQVFLDSRGMPAYDPALVSAYVNTWDLRRDLSERRQSWRKLADEWGIAVALVERPRLKEALRAEAQNWEEVLLPTQSIFSVFVRKQR